MSLLSTLLVTLAGLSLATMFVSWLVASRSAREARITIFPIVREEEMTRARRARIMSSLTGVVAAIMAGAFFLSGQVAAPTAAPQMLAQATLPPRAQPPVGDAQPPTGTEAVLASATPSAQPPSGTAKVVAPAPPTTTPLPPSAQPPPLETNTPVAVPPAPTPTLPPSAQPPLGTATLPPATAALTSTEVTSDTATSAPTPASPISPVESAQPPFGTPTAMVETPVPPGTQIGPIAFSAQVTARRQPISPTTVFSDTISRVYAVFPYRGMRDGMTWSQVWYFNGIEFNRGQDTWRWGATDLSYVFTKVVGVGTYRLELYVNNTLLSSGEFAVQGPAAIGGPENP
jgi:hypothetical protein